jgi:Uncharacterized protein conserved in bacteria (DUF2219)
MYGRWRLWVTLAVLTAGPHGIAWSADEPSDLQLPSERGYSIQLDNDLFSGSHRDQDYSWGMAVTYASPRPGKLMRPLHSVRDRLDEWLVPDETERGGWTPEQQATQMGILAMTPQSLRSPEPLVNDRPFANLIFMTSSAVRVLDGGERARFSSFTFGVLGLHEAETVHRHVHKALGNEMPQGWEHQISSGGEPTARYVEAQQWLLGGTERDPSLPELKFTVAGSAGFITEGSVALSARWGRIQSPWWSFSPELGDYTSAPLAPVERFSSQSPAEFFAFAGVRLKARGYNALLQGQFKHSDVRVQGDDLAHTLAEAWVGLASTWGENRITYTLHYATSEMTVEPGKRGLIWAGIAFERSL